MLSAGAPWDRGRAIIGYGRREGMGLSWWDDYNGNLWRRVVAPEAAPAVLSVDICRLLDDVDAAFRTIAGESATGWPDPHADGSRSDDEYSRCSEPGRYTIVARARAWRAVLRQGVGA